jgi:hypothetical protein
MKIRNLILICSLAGISLTVQGQENVVGKGTTMIMGLGSFSSQKYNSSSSRISALAISTSCDYFYKNNVFLGGGFSLGYQGVSGYNSTALAVGPELGFAFGNENSNVYPYIDAGCHFDYTSVSHSYITSTYGAGVSAGLGLLIPLQKHVGLAIEAKYNTLKFFDSDNKQNTLSLNFGFVGLLF